MVKKTENILNDLNFQHEEVQVRFLQLFRYAQVGRCVNGVTHDINNYLGAISAYAELVSLEETLSIDAKRMLNEVVEGVSKCSALINCLTCIAREEKPTASMADPNAIARDLEKLFSYELRRQRIQFELQLTENMPSMVADVPKLQLALMYLVFNSIEALQEWPEKRIRLAVSKSDMGTCFSLWNSGPALNEQDLADSIQMFRTTKTGHHLGLGLKAVQDAVSLHSGTFTYDSQAGFRLEIPQKNPFRNLARS